MAIRQSNTHQAKYKLVCSNGKVNYYYDPMFGLEKIKELLATRTSITWNPSLSNPYFIDLVADIDENNLYVQVPCDNKLSVKSPFPTQWDKYRGGVKVGTIYYSEHTEYTTGELPWEGSGYSDKGRLNAKYVVNGPIMDNGKRDRSKFIDMTRVRNGKTLKTELQEFATKYNIDLPDHDIDDPKILQIYVGYKGVYCLDQTQSVGSLSVKKSSSFAR